MQRQQRFRNSPKDEAYYLWIKNEYGPEEWRWKNEAVKPAEFGELSGISIDKFKLDSCGTGNDFWFNLEAKPIYQQLAAELNIGKIEEISYRFGEIRLIEYGNNLQAYQYHPNLGLFQDIGENT